MLGRKKEGIQVVLAFIALLLCGKVAMAQQAYVVKIIDGDSLVVKLDSGKKTQFRLYGIDAPEYGQRYSQSPKIYLQKNILHKNIEYTQITKDKYKRHIVVARYKGKTINEELVKKGYVWVYPRYCKKRVCKKWKNLEKRARARKNGLWRDASPTAPWKWRYK